MDIYWTEFLSFTLAAAGAALFTPLVIVLAHRVGAVAAPRPDRWNQRPTALLGGVAIYVASMGAAAALAPRFLTAGLAGPYRFSFWIAAALVFILGLIDDRHGVSPRAKLVVESLAAALVVISGLRVQGISPDWLAVPLTLVWLVGTTNAVNLLDNMDGVAAGVVAFGAMTAAACAATCGHRDALLIALCLTGACCGFLIHNFHPARVFMGHCGSLYLGFMLGALALSAPAWQPAHPIATLIVPVAVLAIPIGDTTLVMAARMLHRRPLFEGGRDHSTHRLAALGLSERAIALLTYAAGTLVGGVGLAALHLSGVWALALALPAFLALACVGVSLGSIPVYPDQESAVLYEDGRLEAVTRPPTAPSHILEA